MDFGKIIGLVLVPGILFAGVSISGGVGAFNDPPALLIVVGGTLATAFLAVPLPVLMAAPKVLLKLVLGKETNPVELIVALVTLARRARKEGLLALENDIETIEDPFLRKGMQLAVDGMEPNGLREVLQLEIKTMKQRHAVNRAFFDHGSVIAPGFGLIATLMGLIHMLGNLSDPSSLGPSMAMAFIGTFYGGVVAYTLVIPISSALFNKTEDESRIRSMVLEGVIGIQSGESPRVIEEKLKAFLPPAKRKLVPDLSSGAGGEARDAAA